MSMLAFKYDIVIDRGVFCVGHGKSLVDAINGVSKNAILRAFSRKVKDAADAGKEDKKLLSVHVYQKDKGQVSPPDECRIFWKTIINWKRKKEKRRRDIT